MAISTLNKFTVPLAADGATDNSFGSTLMPKLKYRFRVVVENFGYNTEKVTEITKQVKNFTRPSLKFEDVVLDVYNSKINLAGKHSWSEASLIVRDDAVGRVSQMVGEQLQKQFDFHEMASAVAGIDYKFLLRCQILDGGNGGHAVNVLEEWELYGCYLNSVDYQGLDYKESGDVDIKLSIKFDNAQNSNVALPGVGTTLNSNRTTDGTLSTGSGTA